MSVADVQREEQRMRQTRWTREAIAAAIRAFHAETGEWPLALDCCSANGLPAYDTILWHFETLADARRHAGMPGGGWERRGPWEGEP